MRTKSAAGFQAIVTGGRWMIASLMLAVLCSIGMTPAIAQSSTAILHELQRFREMGRVMHVAAHPDDENTQLIAYLAHGRGYRTAYLSMTRGEGGQNLIGDELGDALGAIRTHELLAARRIDGGEQYFTRASDFGYSKNYRETLETWGHDEVLSDVVFAIRHFRPHVIITRFPPEHVDGLHGHHSASAVLAVEAFRLAGDPAAYPDQLQLVDPWQPTRILWNRWGSAEPSDDDIRLEVGGYHPLLGRSYGEIAALSRSMHKSQGFGAVGTRGQRFERLTHLAGEPARRDLFDGIESGWGTFAEEGTIESRIDAIVASFDPLDPSASVPALVRLRDEMDQLPDDVIIEEKRRDLEAIIVSAAGLHIETTSPTAEVVPGEALALQHSITVRSEVPVRWIETLNDGRPVPDHRKVDLVPNQTATRTATHRFPSDAALSHPFWLSEGKSPVQAIRPENGPALEVRHVVEVYGRRIEIDDAPVQVVRDPIRGEVRNRIQIVPPVILSFLEEVQLFQPGSGQEVVVEITATRAPAGGILRLEVPDGWRLEPAAQPFSLENSGDRQRFSFLVTAPSRRERAEITMSADIDERRYTRTRNEIAYDHIPRQLLQPRARLVAVGVDLETSDRRVAYVPGPGDRTAEALRRMAYSVDEVPAAELTLDRLRAYDTVVFGIRAFNTEDELAGRLSDVFAWIEDGGTAIVQYQVSRGLVTDR
ncbi:MAG: PIG-L family deacetylase, partial [Bacteroidota bacterium]